MLVTALRRRRINMAIVRLILTLMFGFDRIRTDFTGLNILSRIQSKFQIVTIKKNWRCVVVTEHCPNFAFNKNIITPASQKTRYFSEVIPARGVQPGSIQSSLHVASNFNRKIRDILKMPHIHSVLYAIIGFLFMIILVLLLVSYQ